MLNWFLIHHLNSFTNQFSSYKGFRFLLYTEEESLVNLYNVKCVSIVESQYIGTATFAVQKMNCVDRVRVKHPSSLSIVCRDPY